MSQLNNPLHGVKLLHMVEALVAFYGWEQLALRVPVRCFTFDPSVKSSLKFLRKTPWAREKLEQLYVARKARTTLRRNLSKRRGRKAVITLLVH